MASVAAMIRVTGPNCMHKLPINILKLLHALFANLDDAMLEGKTMCRIKNERKDMNGRNVSGHFVVQGVIQALSPTKSVRVTAEMAPSLGYVDNGKGKSLKVVNLADLVNIFEQHWKAESAAVDAAVAFAPMGSANAKSVVMNKHGITKVSAMVLKKLLGFENVKMAMLDGNTLRQLCQDYIDNKGTIIGGRFITVDVVAVVLFDGNLVYARQWLNNLLTHGKDVASITYVASGHASVSVI